MTARNDGLDIRSRTVIYDDGARYTPDMNEIIIWRQVLVVILDVSVVYSHTYAHVHMPAYVCPRTYAQIHMLTYIRSQTAKSTQDQTSCSRFELAEE